ncbi:DUF1476 domain-containing protein [Neorhizobium lilium]|nr:DUF1476 domain-containing protein [Neorhizobium lilium]
MIYNLRDRGRALEDKFAYEQTLNFRAEARRARLLGLWAASLLGTNDRELYTREVVTLALSGTSDADIAAKLRHDFDAAGVTLPEDELLHHMQDLLFEAQRDLAA